MTEHIHISQGEIEKAVLAMRKMIREGGDGSPEDQCYARLGGNDILVPVERGGRA